MTPRQVLLAWLLGPLVLLGALALAARIAPGPERRFDGAPVVAIGSSLTMHAMPASFALSDGRQVRRIGISVPSERQLLTLVEAAIAERSRVVLLEAAPFVADFAFEPQHGCSAPALGLRQGLRRAQVDVVDRLRRLFGQRTSLDGLPDPRRLDRPQEIDPTVMATFYPLTLHAPCEGERLRELVARAKAQGTRIELLALPRSPYGEERLGRVQSDGLGQLTEAMAADLGVPLLPPAKLWTNAEFTDHAHLNARGRERYLRDLDVWLVGLE